MESFLIGSFHKPPSSLPFPATAEVFSLPTGIYTYYTIQELLKLFTFFAVLKNYGLYSYVMRTLFFSD